MKLFNCAPTIWVPLLLFVSFVDIRSSMHGIGLAQKLLAEKRLPLIDRMTCDNERFHHSQICEAIDRAADKDSLKIVIEWD